MIYDIKVTGLINFTLCFTIKHFRVSFVENNCDRNKKKHQEYARTLTFSHNTKENIGCPFRFFVIS